MGHFRLVRLLGEGAFGAVYEAQHSTLGGRRAAVKILHPQLSLSEELKQRFINEADSASRTDHENIVQVFDGGVTQDGLCYVVMELLKGQSVTQLLRGAPDGLGVARTCNLGIQVASALAAAHALGIVHRDLKPDNLVVVPREANPEFVKVLDFGIAKLQRSEKHTQTGMWLGTPAYMCPEQWQTLPDIDGRADIYALGVILFECLCGVRPFSAPSPFAWLTAHLSHPIPDPGGVAPPALRHLVMSMLAKDRAQRPQSMREVAQELRGILALSSQPGAAPPPAQVQPPVLPSLSLVGVEAQTLVTSLPQRSLPLPSSQGEVMASRPPLRRGLWLGGGALVVLIGAAGLWGALRTAKTQDLRSPKPVGATALAGGAAARVDRALTPEPPRSDKAPVLAPLRTKLPETLVVLGPGMLLMGAGQRDRADGPAHSVTVARFALQRREVSMAEYREFVDATSHQGELPWDGVDDFAGVAALPVNQVTRAQAQTYCAWRYRDLGGRLPSEAEWEFAARSGDSRQRFPWSGTRALTVVANVNAGAAGLRPVDSSPEGAAVSGAVNLIGNVAEWVADDAAPYPGSARRPTARGVVRGGGADTSGPALKELSATTRRFVDPQRGGPFIGMRCAASAP